MAKKQNTKGIEEKSEDKQVIVSEEGHGDDSNINEDMPAPKRSKKKFAKRTTGPVNVPLAVLNKRAVDADLAQKAVAARLSGVASVAVAEEQAKIDEEQAEINK